MLETQGRLESFAGDSELLKELSMDVSTEELLNAERAFTYTDLYAMTENENAVVWLTPHAAVVLVTGIGIGVLGRALVGARSDANSFWMLLSGNAEVAVPSRTTTVTVAASLATPATAAATTNVVAVSIPTAATPTAIGTVTLASTSTSDCTIALNVATPFTGQKRKARPS
jgi:hypothetical protein